MGRPEGAAAPVITGEPGSFARSVLAERHPALIAQVLDAFPYPPEYRHALAALLAETAHGVITPLRGGTGGSGGVAGASGGPDADDGSGGVAGASGGPGADDGSGGVAGASGSADAADVAGGDGPGASAGGGGTGAEADRDDAVGTAGGDGTAGVGRSGGGDGGGWVRWSAEYAGRSWFDVPFLWAESYFYRRLLEAVGYFGPGPWRGIDPFAPLKQAELDGAEVAAELAALDDLAALPQDDQDHAVLGAALWGNRADLGFLISSGAVPPDGATSSRPGSRRPAENPLLADDGAAFWRHLADTAPGTVYLVADNAGRELIPDLVLLDHLLHTGRATGAVLHVKPSPYFVSDATTADAVAALRRLVRAPGRARRIGVRLWDALAAGRLAVRAHPFACAPLPYADMPGDLRADLGRGTVAIVKGDLNYRRLVGDRHWPATTPFAGLTSYFPGPLLALRTLKSDVAVGLAPEVVAAADATGEPWRTSGTRAVVQFRP